MAQNGRKNIFREKQTTNKVPLMFLDVKVLFGLCQETSTVQYMYLPFKDFKIRMNENGQSWLES